MRMQFKHKTLKQNLSKPTKPNLNKTDRNKTNQT